MLNEFPLFQVILIICSSGIITYISTLLLIKYLTKHNIMVQDMPKPGKIMLPRPGGPAIISGILVGGIITYFTVELTSILVLLLSISIAFTIGFIDDRRTMKGWFKPVMLIIASLPLLIFSVNDGLSLPGYGTVMVPILYGGLIIASMPLIGNASNSLDVFNGVVTKSFIIAFIALIVTFAITDVQENGLIVIPIVVSLLVFYKFHALPSKIFPGDSGAITIGVAYIGVAIITHLEIIAIIAIIPAILNSFIFLSSTKKIVEHRELKGIPVVLTDDYKLKATNEKTSVSLIRLILTIKPLTEKELGSQIYRFMAFSSILAVGTSLSYMYGSIIPICLTLGIALILIHKSNYIRLYLFILSTWLLIVGFILQLLNIFSAPEWYIHSEWYTQPLPILIIPILLIFIGALVIMKRKLLKPLYDKLSPNINNG